MCSMESQPRHGFTRLTGSERTLPANVRRIKPVDPRERIEVSVYLRDPSAARLVGDMKAHARQPGQSTSREAYVSEHSANPEDIARVEAFAHAHDLDVVEADPVARRIVLAGDASRLATAFGTELHHYTSNGQTFRGR